MRRTFRWFLLAGAMAAAGLAVLALRDAPVPAAASALEAPRLPVALGRIEPVSEVITLAPPQGSRSSRIAELHVAQGERVARGQVLARMDNAASLAAALRQAEVTLAQREARLAQRLAELETEEASLAAALELERATRNRARWELERMLRLERGGVYRDAALIDKRLALEAADQRVISAELVLARAQRRDGEGRRLEEAVLRGEAAMAEASVQQMRAELEMATLRSPITGTVLRLNARPGEVAGNDGLMLLGDLSRMRVRAEVFESDIAGIASGRPVRVMSRALAEPLAGEVEWIGLRVTRQTLVREDPAATLDARMVEVMVALDTAASARAAGFTGLQVRVFFEGAP